MTENPEVLGVKLDPTSYESAMAQILSWANREESRYVCAANVHMLMEAYDAPDFKDIVNHADLVTPDGMPLVWTLRRLGYPDQQRVYGPDLTFHVLAEAERRNTPVGFFGGDPDTLERMLNNLKVYFPSLSVVYRFSPPFRQLSFDEDQQITSDIISSGARILFVGFGCPKQERWMAAHKDKVQSVMLGVGAAFDFYAGTKRQAPKWMQAIGLEWLFRLAQEPQRLWRRYLIYNSRFIVLILRQLLLRENNKSLR